MFIGHYLSVHELDAVKKLKAKLREQGVRVALPIGVIPLSSYAILTAPNGLVYALGIIMLSMSILVTITDVNSIVETRRTTRLKVEELRLLSQLRESDPVARKKWADQDLLAYSDDTGEQLD